jgi:hypothetical protein
VTDKGSVQVTTSINIQKFDNNSGLKVGKGKAATKGGHILACRVFPCLFWKRAVCPGGQII